MTMCPISDKEKQVSEALEQLHLEQLLPKMSFCSCNLNIWSFEI